MTNLKASTFSFPVSAVLGSILRSYSPGNLSWAPPAKEFREAEPEVRGGVEAPEATEPLDEDGGRSERPEASLDSARERSNQ